MTLTAGSSRRSPAPHPQRAQGRTLAIASKWEPYGRLPQKPQPARTRAVPSNRIGKHCFTMAAPISRLGGERWRPQWLSCSATRRARSPLGSPFRPRPEPWIDLRTRSPWRRRRAILLPCRVGSRSSAPLVVDMAQSPTAPTTTGKPRADSCLQSLGGRRGAEKQPRGTGSERPTTARRPLCAWVDADHGCPDSDSGL